MRRHEYEQFMKGSLFGLLADCVNYCSQHGEVSDEEDWQLNHLLDSLYKEELQKKGIENVCY